MPTPTVTTVPSGLRPFWRLVLLTGGLLLAGALIIAFEVLYSGNDLATLRRSLVRHSETSWHNQIQLGVGPVVLGLARMGLAFVDLPQEARVALSAVRSAEISINEWQAHSGEPSRARMLERADAAMRELGWDRVVAVVDRQDSVAIYVPRQASSKHSLRLCLAVVEHRQMVLVAARIDPEPLVALLNSQECPQVEWKRLKLSMGEPDCEAVQPISPGRL